MHTFYILFLEFVLITSLAVPFSMSDPISNDLLELLKTQLDGLQAKMDLSLAKINLLESKNAEQQNEIIKLKAEVKSNPSSRSFTNESDRHSINFDDVSFINRKRSSSGKPTTRAVPFPSSCGDLSTIGHSLDGFYLVKNPTTSKMETVFCDFVTSVSQELIGNVDVKTKSVHFYVQRQTSFGTSNAIIPWEIEQLNEGQAMDLASGIFIAPVAGIYHFEFSGVSITYYLFIHLQVNGVHVGWAFTKKPNGDEYNTISLSSSLRLEAGDKVNLFNDEGKLVDGYNNFHSTHFTGWLLEEDLD